MDGLDDKDRKFLERVMKSEDEDRRVRWRDRTIEDLRISERGWTYRSWNIFEIQTKRGYMQLLLGTASPRENISLKQVMNLADDVERVATEKEREYTFEMRKDYALLTQLYGGASLIVYSDRHEKVIPCSPQQTLEQKSSIMLLALPYHPNAKIDVPEFKEHEEAFRLLASI